MNIVLSFIGVLPSYIVDCVHQIQTFSTLPIFLIYSDYESKYIEKLNKIHLIKYDDINYGYKKTLKAMKNRFCKVDELENRSLLFYRSFERSYLLRNFSQKYNIENIISLEIDILIYDDPRKWFDIFEKKNVKIAFPIDNYKGSRGSLCICYFKNSQYIKLLTDYFDNFYLKSKKYRKTQRDFLNEMTAVFDFYEKNKDICYILPTHFDNEKYNVIADNFKDFNTIFDASAYGIFLLGTHPINSGGISKLYQEWIGSDIKLKLGQVDWREDKKKIKKPYWVFNDKKILINNLHVHSKKLSKGLSIQHL